MALRFYSKEWLEATIDKANNDQEYLKKAADLSAALLTVVLDCPDGNDVRVLTKFDKGKVVYYEYDARPAPASFRMENEPWDDTVSIARAQASYDTYKKLQTKELSALKAIVDKLYKTEGNMAKVMSLMSYLQAFNDLQATVDCEY